jgi:hypothetical protein
MGRLLQHVSFVTVEFPSTGVTITDVFFARWEANEMMINVSCDALGYSGVPNPSREELDGIVDAISAESKDSGLDERFLLAIMVSIPPVSSPFLHVIDSNECVADARVQRLCASKVHIVAGRFDQESWADASECEGFLVLCYMW